MVGFWQTCGVLRAAGGRSCGSSSEELTINSMKWTRVREWSSRRPVLLGWFAREVACSADDLVVGLETVRESGTIPGLEERPRAAEWVRLYRQHRQHRETRRAVLELLVGLFGTHFGIGVEEIEQLAGGLGHSMPSSAAEARRAVEELGDEGIREVWEQARGVLGEIEQLQHEEWEPDEDNGVLDEALKSPALAFVVLVCWPCWMEYGVHPQVLMRQARLGDIDALEKLLWLDKSALQDRRIGAIWHEASLDRNSARFKRLHRALGESPKPKLGRREYKVSIAGLISRISQLLESATAGLPEQFRCKRLTAPEIRDLFDAVATDKGLGLIDGDLPERLQTFSKAIQRNGPFWKMLELPGHK